MRYFAKWRYPSQKRFMHCKKATWQTSKHLNTSKCPDCETICCAISNTQSLKMNIIEWLELKLASYDVTVQHVCHYSIVTPLIYSNKNKGINHYYYFCSSFFSILLSPFIIIVMKIQQISNNWIDKIKTLHTKVRKSLLP